MQHFIEWFHHNFSFFCIKMFGQCFYHFSFTPKHPFVNCQLKYKKKNQSMFKKTSHLKEGEWWTHLDLDTHLALHIEWMQFQYWKEEVNAKYICNLCSVCLCKSTSSQIEFMQSKRSNGELFPFHYKMITK